MNKEGASINISNRGRHSGLKASQTAYISAQKKLTYIPLVFMIGRIWGTVRFILVQYENSNGLQVLAAFIAILQVDVIDHC